MPVEVAIWELGERVDRISFEPMLSESQLEDILAQDVSILDDQMESREGKPHHDQ